MGMGRYLYVFRKTGDVNTAESNETENNTKNVCLRVNIVGSDLREWNSLDLKVLGRHVNTVCKLSGRSFRLTSPVGGQAPQLGPNRYFRQGENNSERKFKQQNPRNNETYIHLKKLKQIKHLQPPRSCLVAGQDLKSKQNLIEK